MSVLKKTLLTALVVAGCQYEPIDFVGLKCGEQRQCPVGLMCRAGQCAEADAGVDGGADAGRPAINVLRNSGFEQRKSDGGVTGWRSVFSNTAVEPVMSGRSGGLAVRLSHLASNFAYLTSTDYPLNDMPLPLDAGLRYCARAWVRPDNDDETVYLSVTHTDLDGNNSAQRKPGEHIFERLAKSRWTQLHIDQPVAFDGRRSTVSLQIWVPGADAGAVLIDDAELWEVGDRGCPW